MNDHSRAAFIETDPFGGSSSRSPYGRSVRRGVLILVTAAAVGAALWIVCGLASSAVVWSSTRWTPAFELFVPPTVPYASWAQPAPWNVLVPAFGALLLGGLTGLAFTGLAVWRGWRDATTGVRFLTAWLALVIVALVTAAVWTLGATLADLGPNGWAWAFRFAQPGLLASALFGIVWGWVPALVLALSGPPMISRSRRTGWVVIVVAILVLGLGAGVVSGQPAAVRAGRVAAGGTPDGRPTMTPTPTSTPTVTAEPPALVSADPVQPGPDWCAPETTSLTVSGVGSALGHRVMTLVLVNDSAQSCVVDGYPDAAFAGPDGNALTVTMTHGSSYVATDPGPVAISLAPGAALAATLSWGASSAGQTTAATLWAAPYAGAARAQLAISADISRGTTVTATAWAPTTG